MSNLLGVTIGPQALLVYQPGQVRKKAAVVNRAGAWMWRIAAPATGACLIIHSKKFQVQAE